MINPANSGFFPASHALNAMATAEMMIFNPNIHMAFNDDGACHRRVCALLVALAFFLIERQHKYSHSSQLPRLTL